MGVASGDHTHSTGVQTEEKREEEKRGVVSLEDKLRVLDEEHVAQLAEEDVEGDGEGGGKDRGGVKEEQRRREYEEELRKEVERKMEEFRFGILNNYPPLGKRWENATGKCWAKVAWRISQENC